MSDLRFQKVVLIGAGLIGASLGRDILRLKLARHVVGFDPARKNLLTAKKLGAITSSGASLKSELAEAELVIFAAPVSVIKKLLTEYAAWIPANALVIDVGSTKGGILKVAALGFPSGNFVGCHPMAGTENSGAKASLDGLFQGKTCFIVGDAAKSRFVKKSVLLWRKLGAKPILIKAIAHDRIAAHVSHLPHFVSFALMNAVECVGTDRVGKFSGGGLRDTTRIAASSPEMWRDIFLANKEAVSAALTGFKKELMTFEKALKKRDGKGLASFMAKAARLRRKL